ncbi:MAG TPA: CorA family divalent cation transporter [Streptosporangiaceae bacterium]|jgi:Mg2+ and Co2+ transporter CorA|nr:CorA family divalent cation transporter [Streptosporangiaceae bacterium]
MPVTTSSGRGSSVARATLADADGLVDPAQPQDAQRRLAAGAFVWLDLEGQDEREVEAFSRSLGIAGQALQTLTAVSYRPSFDVAGDSIHAVVPGSNWGRDADGIVSIRVIFKAGFLLTTHRQPCQAIERLQRRWHDVPDEVKADGPALFFFILHEIVGSFEPALLQLHNELEKVERATVTVSPSGAEQELSSIRHQLSETVQGLGWYLGDLNRYHGRRMSPGIGMTAGPSIDLHRTRVVQLRDAAKGYRNQSQDVLGQVGSDVSGRQGYFINILTVFSTVFLPLTFLTSYFGMNFGVITKDLDSIWSFALLGIALPVATLIATLAFLRRLITRMGLQSILPSRPAAEAEPNSASGRQHELGS